MTANTVRFRAAMRYAHQYISSDLALYIDEALRGNVTDEQAGALISLDGKHIMGSDDKRKALRVLILCHRAFLNAPYSVGAGGAPFTYNNAPNTVYPKYRWSQENTVRNAINCYGVNANATRADLAREAEGLRRPQGGITWETLTRSTNPFPAMPVCFDALKMLLFKAGFVSIRWLAQTGPTMTAQTVNNILGQGQVVNEAALDTMPRGYMFNFHRQNDQAVCHWGISLGGGWAAGANTQSNWPGAPAAVNFRSGGSAYGIFTMRSSYNVCRFKYGQNARVATNVTIRRIDPTAVATYF